MGNHVSSYTNAAHARKGSDDGYADIYECIVRDSARTLADVIVGDRSASLLTYFTSTNNNSGRDAMISNSHQRMVKFGEVMAYHGWMRSLHTNSSIL